MRNVVIGVVVIIVLVAGGLLLSGRNANQMQKEMTQSENTSTPSPEVTKAASESAAPSPEQAMDSAMKTIKIEAGSFYFNPKEIRVKKGDKVEVVLTSKDMMHDFVIDELNVKGPVTKAGETSTVSFTADKVGTFEYYCSVGKHRQMGQVGTLIVE